MAKIPTTIKPVIWSWRTDCPASVMWTSIMTMAAVGKYHLEINGAANIFAAMCVLYGVIGLLRMFTNPAHVVQGKPWVFRFTERAVLWALIAATVWFGDWWHFAALIAFLIGSAAHRKAAESRYADQQVA